MVRTIVLHAGTPKTGTTSLQVFLDAQRPLLAQAGICYPFAPASGPADRRPPKHRWLMPALTASDARGLETGLANVLAQADTQAHTIILSNEGIYGSWPLVSPAARAWLANLAVRFNVELWVWFRDPASFAASQYIQALKDIPNEHSCAGRNVDFVDFLDDPWFARRFDYIGFVRQGQALLGPGAVRAFRYDGRTVGAFLKALGASCDAEPERREKASFGGLGVELLQLLNGYETAPQAKRLLVERVGEIDALIEAASWRAPRTTDVRLRLEALCAPSLAALRAEFSLELNL